MMGSVGLGCSGSGVVAKNAMDWPHFRVRSQRWRRGTLNRMKKLTPRMNRFVEEYLIDLNATQAAIRVMTSGIPVPWFCGSSLDRHSACEHKDEHDQQDDPQ